MSSLFSITGQHLERNNSLLWPYRPENSIQNYQGYHIIFTVFEKGLFCTVEKDGVVRRNVPVVALSGYEFSQELPSSRLITFDQFHRTLFVGERAGLQGGGCCQSKGEENEDTNPLLGNRQRSYLSTSNFPLDKALAQIGQKSDEDINGFIEAKLIEHSYYKTGSPKHVMLADLNYSRI